MSISTTAAVKKRFEELREEMIKEFGFKPSQSQLIMYLIGHYSKTVKK